jgi:hypothetical protein
MRTLFTIFLLSISLFVFSQREQTSTRFTGPIGVVATPVAGIDVSYDSTWTARIIGQSSSGYKSLLMSDDLLGFGISGQLLFYAPLGGGQGGLFQGNLGSGAESRIYWGSLVGVTNEAKVDSFGINLNILNGAAGLAIRTSDSSLVFNGDLIPSANNTHDIGTSSLRPDSVYVNVLSPNSIIGYDTAYWDLSGSNIYRAIGNVGIGITNPARTLQIAGSFQVDSAQYSIAVRKEKLGLASYTGVGMVSTNGTQQFITGNLIDAGNKAGIFADSAGLRKANIEIRDESGIENIYLQTTDGEIFIQPKNQLTVDAERVRIKSILPIDSLTTYTIGGTTAGNRFNLNANNLDATQITTTELTFDPLPPTDTSGLATGDVYRVGNQLRIKL